MKRSVHDPPRGIRSPVPPRAAVGLESDTSLPQSAPSSRSRRSRTSCRRSPTTATSGHVVKELSWEWLAALAAATRPQPRHLRPAVAGRAPRASRSVPPSCSRRSRRRSRWSCRAARRSGSRARTGSSGAGGSGQRHRRAGHARQPLEPVREPVLPDHRRVPARGRGRAARRSSRRRPSSARPCSASRSPRSRACSRAAGLAAEIGDLAAQLADWALRQVRRGAGRLGRRELRAVPRSRPSICCAAAGTC